MPDVAERLRIAGDARATLARRSLAKFVQQAIAAGEVDGIHRVDWGPHLDAVCSEVQAQLEGWLVAHGLSTPQMVARQQEAWERTGATWEDGAPEPWLRYPLVQNAIDNLPPGTLKSTIVMVCANAWIWLWAPTFSFGALSGIDANVGRDSRACRELVRSSWYRETFEIVWTDTDADLEIDPADLEIKHDTDAVEAWATTAGGKRISRTITRGLTGTHVDGIYLDDPDDADKVYNEADRLRPQNRWTRSTETRVNDEHRSIRRVLQQVVHVEGMTAYLLSMKRWSPANPKGWSRLCIPAEFGLGPPDAPIETPYGWRDWRTQHSETMHARLSPGVLADKRMSIPGYEGQFNQNPRRTGSGMFKRSNFQIVDEIPHGGRWVRRWDLAASVDKSAAFTAGPLVGLVGGRLFVRDVQRGQWGPHDRDQKILTTAREDGRNIEVWLPQDPGQAGLSQKPHFGALLHGFTVHFERESVKKEIRWDPYASQVEARNVYLLRGEWNRRFLDEHEAAPHGKIKDQIDAMAGAYYALIVRADDFITAEPIIGYASDSSPVTSGSDSTLVDWCG